MMQDNNIPKPQDFFNIILKILKNSITPITREDLIDRAIISILEEKTIERHSSSEKNNPEEKH